MKTKESKAKGKKVTLKDLPAKRLSREQEAKVKGGLTRRAPLPAGPINE